MTVVSTSSELRYMAAKRSIGIRLATVLLAWSVPLTLLRWLDPCRFDLPMCWFHAQTGMHCMGCGATRATHELLHGRLLSALHFNALWVVLIPLVVYVAISESRRYVLGKPLPGRLWDKRWLWTLLVMLALGFFVVRNFPAYPWTLLAPPA